MSVGQGMLPAALVVIVPFRPHSLHDRKMNGVLGSPSRTHTPGTFCVLPEISVSALPMSKSGLLQVVVGAKRCTRSLHTV